jgi:protein TonB
MRYDRGPNMARAVSTTGTLGHDALSPSATVLGAALAASCLLPAAPPLPVVPPTRPVAKRVAAQLPTPASPEPASESRDVERPQPEPLKQREQETRPLEAAATPAASSAGAAGTQSPPMSAAAFAEGAGEITARLTQTRAAQSSGSAAATGPVAAIRPNSVAAPRITQAARPSGGYQVRPTYPPAARRAGAEGTTLLRVHVLDDGRIGQVEVERSAGHVALDQAAAEAIRRWHFEPARSGSETVAVWVLIPVEFRLRSGL